MQTKRTVTIFMLQIQGCIWAAPLGKWRRKIATGAFFGKQCARHGALVYYQAHFLKMGAPEFSNFLFFSLKLLLPFYLVNKFCWSIRCPVQVGQRQGKSGYFTINFQIRENQGILPFLLKIRGKSGDFIMDTGKKSWIYDCFVRFP